MKSKPSVLVGRAATPVPPNVGSSTLGEALRLSRAPHLAQREHVLTVVSPRLFEALEEVAPVFPAVPGLTSEAVEKLNVRCLVVEEAALLQGVWAGYPESFGTELRTELLDLFEQVRTSGIPAYWVRSASAAETAGPGEQEPEEQAPGLPDLPCPDAVLIAAGTPMGVGTEEGAPPSRLVAVLRKAALDRT